MLTITHHLKIQALAEETGGFVGDSLAMAQFGARQTHQKLLIAGVKFMAETAKILNPEKTILIADPEATCSLDLDCPIEAFSQFCDQHPDRNVVVYANTSAHVKARADWVVSSSIGLPIIQHLHDQGKKILWASDKYLGAYLQKQTGADMLLWDGSCIVHEEFKSQQLQALQQQYPNAAVLVHPESPASIIDLADVVGSTSQLIAAATKLENDTFIVATEEGIFYKMHQAAPEKQFILAPTAGNGAECRSCGICPWMRMNQLSAVSDALNDENNAVVVDETVRRDAVKSLQRMLTFAEQHGL